MPKTFLPFVAGDADDVSAQSESCGMDDLEAAILRLMQAHPDQGRTVMECHPILVAVARSKALDLAIRGYEAHTDPDGHGANWLLRRAGYRLPDNYHGHDSANNVESAGWGGDGTPEQMWDSWLGSDGHRIHALGLDDTYQPQTRVGVGHVFRKFSRWGNYWVLLTAHPEPMGL